MNQTPKSYTFRQHVGPSNNLLSFFVVILFFFSNEISNFKLRSKKVKIKTLVLAVNGNFYLFLVYIYKKIHILVFT